MLVFGESEIRYLESLTSEARDATLARLYSHDIPAVLITQGFEPPAALAEAAERIAVPLLRTQNGTPHAMSQNLPYTCEPPLISTVMPGPVASAGDIQHGAPVRAPGLGSPALRKVD